MSTPLTPAETADHAAWAQQVRRGLVEALGELAQSGLRLAQAIESQAVEGAASGTPAPGEAAMAFGRAARAVRMTCLLQSRLIKDMDEALSKQAFERRCEAQRAEADADEAREKRVERTQAIVARVARAGGCDEDRIERLIDEAGERLEDDDIYGDVLTRPMAALVADICRDLGLEPDWDLLGQEAWLNPPPFAQANGGGGPRAERSVVEGESPIQSRWRPPKPEAEPAESPLAPSTTRSSAGGPRPDQSHAMDQTPFAAANGGGRSH